MARRRLSSELIDAGVFESVVDDASVILSELLSNALRHARPLPSGQVRVTWGRRGDRLEVAVSDGGAMTEPRRKPGALSSLGGRGLGIVEALSEGWGVRHEDGVTTVWAVLHAPRSTRSNGSAPHRMVPTLFPDFEIGDVSDGPENGLVNGRHSGTATTRAYPA
jgi:anti-sigma regulatory factor (Ser/Thr protein kinase)